MRIAIVGGRRRRDKDYVRSVLDQFVQEGDTIISGGARGADQMARDYAEERKLSFVEYRPEPPAFREQLMARNTLIAEACEVLFAFPDAWSRGTYDTIHKAESKGKRVVVFPPEDELE